MSTVDVLDTVMREADAGRRAALCVIVATRGSTPQPAGTTVCVDEAARMTGTLGGGCVEAEVRRRAHQLLLAGQSKLLTFALDHDFGYDDGMICGGQMDVAVSVLSPVTDVASPPCGRRSTPGAQRPPRGAAATVGPTSLMWYREAVERLRAGQTVVLPVRVEGATGFVEYRVHVEAAPELVIAGAGHISRVLAQMVVPLGFCVHVVDDRADYANPDRFAPPIQTSVGDIASTLKTWPVGANTYVVIVTRGHRQDENTLRAVLESRARYIGMIGSRRKIEVIFDDLRHEGATDEQLGRVHAPIGLDIGAVTAEEIALSIAAQLVAARRSDCQVGVDGPFPVADDTA